MADIIPAEILQRPKAGFALPTDIWLKGPLKPLVQSAIHWAANSGMFNGAYLAELFQSHETGRRNNQRVLWSLMMFQLWHEQHVPAPTN